MSDAFLYAVGGLVAAEATGVTNFSGGTRSGGGGGSGGGGINVELPEVANGLAGLSAQMDATTDAVTQATKLAAQANALAADARAAANSGGNTVETIRETVTHYVPTGNGGNGSGGNGGNGSGGGTPSLFDMTNPNLAGLTGGNNGGSGPSGGPSWDNHPDSPGGSEHTLDESEFGIVRDLNAAFRGMGQAAGEGGKFVRENPAAVGGAAVGLAAAPFTGGVSIPVAAAATGGAAEIGMDNTKVDEAVGRQFDDKPGGGIFDTGPIFGGGKDKDTSSSKSSSSRPTVTSNPDNQPDETNKSQERKQDRKDKGKNNSTGSTPFDKPLVPTGSNNWSF